MNKALPISRLINVSVNLAPNAAQIQDIHTLLILGNSGVIDNVEKIRRYSSIDAVAFDFGTTAPEYLAAVLWFEQSPQPVDLLVGNWGASGRGRLIGAPLSTAQQALSNFAAISNGYLTVTIDGTDINLSGLSFSNALNLNGVAAIVQAALPVGNLFIWNANNLRFELTSRTSGVTSTVSYFKTTQFPQTIAFTGGISVAGSTLPNDGDTVTLNGVVLTFRTVPALANDVLIGISLTRCLDNLHTVISSSSNPLLTVASYSRTATQILITTTLAVYTVGTSIPLIIIFSGVSNIVPAGNNLYGLFKNTISNVVDGAYLVQGAAIQTLGQVVADYDNNFGQAFYGLTVLGATDAQLLDVSNFIEAANNKHIHAVSTIESGVIVAATTTDIASQLMALGLKRTLCQYSSSNPYSAVSLLSRILTTNYNANNTVITLMYKQEPGIVAEQLSATEIGVLESKNCNVFVAYNNNTAIIEKGVMSNGYFVDEVTGTDWLALTIQNELFNALYTSTTKIPQTDSGVHTLLTVTEGVCSQGVVNGLLAPGVWNAQGFGSLNQGDYLAKGFYVYAASVNTQLSADRAARKSPPIQVAAKLAGAIHTVDVIINVNR